MAEFLLEMFVPRGRPKLADGGAQRARSRAEQLAHEGRRIRYVRSLYVSDDETCFHLFEADSADDVREAARLAGLPLDSIRVAVSGTGALP